MACCDFCSDTDLRGAIVYGCRPFSMRLDADPETDTLVGWCPELDVPLDTMVGLRIEAGSAPDLVRGFAHPREMTTERVGLHRFTGGWAACRRCAPLVASRSWHTLGRRLASRGADQLLVMNALGMWCLFAHFSTGETWRLGTEPRHMRP